MNLDFSGKKVIMRVDFNVPLNEHLAVSDDTRIRAAIPSINHIMNEGAALILMSHLGRPQKKKNDDGSIKVKEFTLKNILSHLSNALGKTVKFCPELIGPTATKMSAELKPGEILLLENTRFEAGESKGDEGLAKALSELAEIYVNDAFGTAHRSHASTAVIAKYFEPSKRCFGFLMEQELKNAANLLSANEKPFTAIVGGAKVSDKIGLINTLIDKANNIIIGGGMAYTLAAAKGGTIGNSLCETDKIALAKELLAKAKEKGVDIYLPEDSLVADEFSNSANTKVCSTLAIEDGWMGLDIGPKAIESFSEVLRNSKVILWNGPMGVFEMESFEKGTLSLATAVAEATKNGAYSLVGGGDSVAAINKSGLAEEVSYVSTGGGAMLELLEGKVLPGVAAIQ
jgi:phosphoglycerate kinase